ncbi:hypothetical protein BCV72DRAFT_119800 [Rhizopus microsporus var. microsporus]|uniref:Uncharacterized protein n=2 Tax=Rhizopus microsporus TaxID=58291 RepID=A0A2G4T3T8_RHIZD|nr:uncharacterized protein RHIMIDRAFT_91876 [Rhizopus microsporus ATCC 52813]ORE06668.1 hypothetical protein BCV72DRAFT_119800 [Rhizopus microsporus var. microsporus]PHZ15682.1 hypothetical protein RHIMIDRAFT_91876 [Rhizopus microsporus ATCC 52813]
MKRLSTKDSLNPDFIKPDNITKDDLEHMLSTDGTAVLGLLVEGNRQALSIYTTFGYFYMGYGAMLYAIDFSSTHRTWKRNHTASSYLLPNMLEK